MDAACGMIDIPLNINYNIFSSLNSRIFIGSGISTFIVLNEKYEYEFSNYADYPDGWETDETSVLWGGFWNITAGMETKILNGWDVRIEPYFRVPVRSVGYGNINLYGSGILFTLKRNFYRPD